MLWKIIHKKQKIGDINNKVHRVVNRECISSVAISLIICLVLFLSGCVSKAVEETLIDEENFAVPEQKKLEVTIPKILEVSEPESLKVSQPKSLKVSEPESLKVSEPKSLEPKTFEKGNYTPAKRENPAYNRCSQLKGFDEQLKCTNEALGITQE